MEADLKDEALWILEQARIVIRGRIGLNKQQDVG